MVHYENNYDWSPFNFKVLGVCFILLLIGIIIIAPMLNRPQPVKFIDMNVSTVTQIEYVTVLVTPTPDGNTYYASEYQTGVRKINRMFSFFREDALGKKDLSVHAVVYDYKTFIKYNWFNPTDYKYYLERAPYGYKYLFVFTAIYADDVIGGDTRFWIPKENQFTVGIKGLSYQLIEFPKQLRIKELENTFNYNENSMVTAYNSLRQYKPNNEYKNTAGESFESIDVLKGGKSNAIDGYFVVLIPDNTKDEDIIVYENFYTFGNAGWRLKP